MDTELNIDIIIETPKGSHIKYKYDPIKKAIFCDKILHTSPIQYRYNQGFIPNTLSENGNTLEAIILMDDTLLPGTFINCKFLGYLDTKDEVGKNPVMIMCPSNKIHPKYIAFKDIINDLNIRIDNSRELIKSYYERMKIEENNNNLTIGDFYCRNEAIQVYIEALTKFSNKQKIGSNKNKITNYFEKI